MTIVKKVQELSRELAGRYELSYEAHDLCGRKISVVCVADAEALFSRRVVVEPGSRGAQDETHPYWGCLWPSALALARVLVTEDLLRPGQKVLELGSGLGLVSAVACLRRARVTATDLDPDALKFTQINCLQIAGAEPEVLRLDWYQPPRDRQYDAILGSDLVYEARSFDPLIACFDALLEPGGRVLFGEPNREMSRPFFDRLPDAGWEYEILSEQPDATVYGITRSPK